MEEKQIKTDGEEQNTSEKDEGTPAPTQNKDNGTAPEETQNPIEEFKKENDRRAEILKQELELQARKERLHAEELATGRGQIIPKTEQKPISDLEYWKEIKKGNIPKMTQ